MAITAYTGLQGSGKSYEVVSEVVLNGVRRGRRIVTNLHGLNVEEITAYCLAKWKQDVSPNITVVTSKQVKSEAFFYWEEEQPDGSMLKASDTICRAGDLVIVDEAWDHFGKKAGGLPDRVQSFMRMHRHYADAETGIVSDIVFITQHIADLHPDIRNVVERTFHMRKLKELGVETGYTVDHHEGASQQRRTHLKRWIKRYDKKIFPLYKSYTGGAGSEHGVDSRQSIFAGGGFFWKMGGALALMVGMGLYLMHWLSGGVVEDPKKGKAADVAAKGDRGAKGSKAGSSGAAASPVAGGSPSGAGAGAGPAAALSASAGPSASQWQQVGYLQQGERLVVVVRSSDGRYRYVRDPDNYGLAGRDLTVRLDGQDVAPWTGSRPGSVRR